MLLGICAPVGNSGEIGRYSGFVASGPLPSGRPLPPEPPIAGPRPSSAPAASSSSVPYLAPTPKICPVPAVVPKQKARPKPRPLPSSSGAGTGQRVLEVLRCHERPSLLAAAINHAIRDCGNISYVLSLDFHQVCDRSGLELEAYREDETGTTYTIVYCYQDSGAAHGQYVLENIDDHDPGRDAGPHDDRYDLC